jgi:hypothetical protein
LVGQGAKNNRAAFNLGMLPTERRKQPSPAPTFSFDHRQERWENNLEKLLVVCVPRILPAISLSEVLDELRQQTLQVLCLSEEKIQAFS